jgi:signal peptidase
MWYLILSLLIAIYILFNLVLTSFFGSPIGAYVLKPAIWISFAVLVVLIANKEGLNIWKFKAIRRWRLGKSPAHAALLIGGFQVSLLIIAGLFVGFGNSPYSHSPLGIIINIIFIGSALLGLELSRAYLIKKGTLTMRNVTFILGLTTVLFMFVNIQLIDITTLSFNEPAAIAQFVGVTVIPLLAMSLLASYFAYLGGALAAISYMGTIQAFEWFSPILPDLNWALIALIGTIGPAISFLIIQSSIQITREISFKGKRRKKTKDPALSWIAVAVVSVLLVFFSFGFLGVQPTVIYSGSMQPTMDVGDIVIISEVPVDTIEGGDIIQYRTASANIIHRVQEVYEEAGTKLFITKGDANNAPDETPIVPEQITGKAVFTIPKLGWIPIAIKQIVNKIGFTI